MLNYAAGSGAVQKVHAPVVEIFITVSTSKELAESGQVHPVQSTVAAAFSYPKADSIGSSISGLTVRKAAGIVWIAVFKDSLYAEPCGFIVYAPAHDLGIAGAAWTVPCRL